MLLSDVCLSVAYIGPNSRTERPRKTKIGTEVAHMTRDSDTTFKVERSKVRSPGRLLTTVLAHQAAAAEGVRTCRPWGNCCYVAACWVVEGAVLPTGEGERRGHTVAAAHLQLVE